MRPSSRKPPYIYNSTARIFVLPVLDVYAPKFMFENNVLNYKFVRSNKNPSIDFPAIIQSDGTPWEIGNLYLISKAVDFQVHHPSVKSIRGIADDLLNYLRFLEDRHLSYLAFPNNEKMRATYRYRKHVEELVLAGEIAHSTGKQRINRIVNFYKDSLRIGLIGPNDIKNAPFEETIKKINSLDGRGFKRSTTVASHNLQLRSKKESPSPEFIQDEGKLRPLPPEDQKLFLSELSKSNNRPLQLIIYIALFSGARLQTCCTIQRNQLNQPLDSSNRLRLRVGAGTGIDTKNQKNQLILIPKWLVTDIRIYLESPARNSRQIKKSKDTSNEYVFLTNRGSPYYTSHSDIERISSHRVSLPTQGKSPKVYDGTTVRVFFSNLIKKIKLNNPEFYSYRFHDLRATFGMNLLESLLSTSDVSTTSALTILQQRLGHSDLSTTMRYMNYRAHTKLFHETQDSYEEELLKYVQH